jgi:hypothetical protein
LLFTSKENVCHGLGAKLASIEVERKSVE